MTWCSYFVCILKQWPLKTVVLFKIKEMSMQVHFCHADAIPYKMTHSLLLKSNCQRPPPPIYLNFPFYQNVRLSYLASRSRATSPAASGAEAEVPVWLLVHWLWRSVDIWNSKMWDISNIRTQCTCISYKLHQKYILLNKSLVIPPQEGREKNCIEIEWLYYQYIIRTCNASARQLFKCTTSTCSTF